MVQLKPVELCMPNRSDSSSTWIFPISIVLLVGCWPLCLPGQEAKDSPSLTQLGILESDEIRESSGICRSVEYPAAYWTHNDSGNGPNVFLLSAEGKTLANVKLKGAVNQDWEDICNAKIEGEPFILIGDVGDNKARRKFCRLYIFKEPRIELGSDSEKIELDSFRCLEFEYDNGPRNCEAIAFDELSQELLLVEKIGLRDAPAQSGVFAIQLQNSAQEQRLKARRIGAVGIRGATAMSLSPDNNWLVIRNYVNAHLYRRTVGQTWPEALANNQPALVGLPIQRQGESICFTADSKSIIVTSESKRQPIWQIRIEDQLE
jgi:hypothetical protein